MNESDILPPLGPPDFLEAQAQIHLVGCGSVRPA